MQQRDFCLILPTSEIVSEIGKDNIKRELYNAQVWLSDFCRDRKLLDRENLSVETENILIYFKRIMQEEGRDIHDYASCSFKNINSYTTETIFRGYRYE